jgi:uncharacterized YigZ family protein
MMIPDGPLPAFTTLAAPGAGEIKVQRSRFVAEAHPVSRREDVDAVVDNMASRYHDSRHVCRGWRLGYDASLTEGRSDGGEPAGTAGEPILGAIRSAGVTDTVVVVVRYFGGVKLGTGGLGRAYREAAAAALNVAPRREVLLGRTFTLGFGYESIGSVEHLLAQYAGRLESSAFTDDVAWTIWLPEDRWEDFARALKTLTHDRIKMRTPE